MTAYLMPHEQLDIALLDRVTETGVEVALMCVSANDTLKET